jgi:hypothetical protein
MPRGDGWSADLQSAPEHPQSLAPGEVILLWGINLTF